MMGVMIDVILRQNEIVLHVISKQDYISEAIETFQ